MLNHLARLFLAGTLLEILWLQCWRLSPLREHSGLFVTLMIAIFVLCLASFRKCPVRDGRGAACVLVFALIFRATVLPAAPDQSEDVYRYLWDGRLAAQGIDPYRYPPDAPELEYLRDGRIYPMLNSKPYVTAYPPLAQALFRCSTALFGPEVIPMKAVFSLLEFASLVLSWRLLILFGMSLQPLILVAWNPLFIFEFSHSGHSDSASMFLILLAIYLLRRSRPYWAVAGFAGAVLAKLHPALWTPLFIRRLGWKTAAAGAAVFIAGWLAYLSPVTWLRYLRSLALYFRLFEFNASIHYLLRFLGRIGWGASWDKVTGPYLAALLVLITVWIARRFPVRTPRDILHAGFWIMTADLCLATTVHPWYLSWAALAIPFFPYAFMVYWTGAAFLSYLAYAYHPVFEPAWVLLIEYVPMYLLMAFEIRRRGPLLTAGTGLPASADGRPAGKPLP